MKKILFLLFIIPHLVGAQIFLKDYNSREIAIQYDDSLINASVLVDKIDYEPMSNNVYYWYQSKQISKNLGGYSGYLLHGEFRVLNKSKQLLTQGSFSLGLKDGMWKRWNSKGGITSIKNYNKGVLQGELLMFNTFGHKIKHAYYNEGILMKDLMQINDSVKAENQIFENQPLPEPKKNVFSKFIKWIKSKDIESEYY